MKRSFFQAAVASILLYGCTSWTLTKRLDGKKLDGNYTKMLRAILNKSWRQHPTRHQLYGHLSPITKTIQVRRTRHAGHCWRSRDEIISDELLWTPTHDCAKAGWPARTYIQQLCEDTGCCPEDLSEAMNEREKWRERRRDIRASSTTWWWWWLLLMFSCGDRLFNSNFSHFSLSLSLSLSLSHSFSLTHTHVIFWPSARAKRHSRCCTERKWHIPMAVRRGNRVDGNWLTKWDELKKSHDTLIDWRTGREWPLNCMTVISTWLRLNIRFKRSSGRSCGLWIII